MEKICAEFQVDEIWISPGHDFRGRHGLDRKNHQIIELDEVECVAGCGLLGDRYFDFKKDFKGQITFFSAEVLDELRARYGELESSRLRRNVIVRGLELHSLIGKVFSIQGVSFEGSEECKPCYWMDEAIGEGAEEFLKADCRGGLRARILSDGRLRTTSFTQSDFSNVCR